MTGWTSTAPRRRIHGDGPRPACVPCTSRIGSAPAVPGTGRRRGRPTTARPRARPVGERLERRSCALVQGRVVGDRANDRGVDRGAAGRCDGVARRTVLAVRRPQHERTLGHDVLRRWPSGLGPSPRDVAQRSSTRAPRGVWRCSRASSRVLREAAARSSGMARSARERPSCVAGARKASGKAKASTMSGQALDDRIAVGRSRLIPRHR